MSENGQRASAKGGTTAAMVLDSEACWRAFSSKDRRFDGRFVAGVLTTGIYCRPACPAPAPMRKNVLFFVSAAAAEEAGLRPCMRCRPDATPGTPAWLGSPATVQRALRLLAEGGAVDDGLEELALRLGIGTRQLRRLFAEHVGASPLAVARTQKLHFARKLLDETDLPMSTVALSSGFRSIRRFNDAIRTTFRRTPTELRQKRRGPAISGIVLRLPYREPFDVTRLLGFLRARAIPGVENVTRSTYSRTIAIDGVVGTIAVEPIAGAPALALRIQVPVVRALYAIVERVRSLFDLRVDPAVVAAVLGRDAALARSLAARPGLRVPGAWDGFELAVRAVLGQQVSVAHATTMSGSLVTAFGEPLPDADPRSGLTHLFPSPAALARADIVARVGMPAARAEAIRTLAAAVSSGAIAFVPGAPDPIVTERLLGLRGIGPWTASYIAMRALADTDAFPEGDLVLRQVLGTRKGPLRPSMLASRAEAWRPWRAYAAMHLWSMKGDSP